MITVIQNHTLQDIVDGARYLLDKAAHSEDVRRLALDISPNGNIEPIYDWVKEHLSYVPDPVLPDGGFIELFISPDRMAKDYYAGHQIGGDCDDHSLLVTSLSRSVGLNANMVLLDICGGGYDHAVSEVYSEQFGEYIMVDTSSDVPLGWYEANYARLVI